jgi:L-amino acid N-acyltransferase YncA
MNVTVRAATLDDLPSITEIHNYYIVNTHITFDVQPHGPEERAQWIHDHSDGRRYRLLAACRDQDDEQTR